MTRRDILWLLGLSAVSVAPSALGGCAAHPVTGQSTLMGLSESEEVDIDRQQAPHQFSNDYGAVQDARLNAYLAQVGGSLAGRSHRPQMPYSYRVVNANYVNAYTFPGGSMAATRGILLEMDNEAELAGLLGHELGHVNSRHTAQQAGRGMVANVLVAGASIATAAAGYQGGAAIVALGGMVGSSALLASYSRDDEREADGLGIDYMTRAQYSPEGMVGLMSMLQRQSKEKPSMLATMFSTHPMSDERYATAKREAESRSAIARGYPLQRERYMDMTAPLRRLQPAIQAEQRGEDQMRRKALPQAEEQLSGALRLAPGDYTGHVLMAKCLLAQKRNGDAQSYLDKAKAIYPTEGQALHLSGLNKLALRQPAAALEEFDRYETALPGSPSTAFLKGLAQESMQNRTAAAREYQRYLRAAPQGDQANYSSQRLRAWGYLK
jgi:predicted Zn-dependent protease